VVTGVALVCAVVLFGTLVLLAVRRSRLRSERRLESVLVEIDGRLEAISASVAHAIERVAGGRPDWPQALLTLDFDALVDSLVAEAAARTGADAVVLRVDGPGGRPVVTSLGAGVGAEQLERGFGPPDAKPFLAATAHWAYRATEEPRDALFHSALVTPMDAAGVSGVLAAYSRAPDAFTREHTAAAAALLEDVAPALANARRFAEVEARTLLDPATGVPSPRGYERELGREVARAHRSGRPLSMVLVGIEGTDRAGPTGRPGNGVTELGRLLKRVTRTTDISCRRGEHEFAILLPGTREAGATTVTRRLHDEVVKKLGAGRSNLTVGYVEWRPDETVESLDARADAALGRHVTVLDAFVARTPPPSSGPTSVLRRDVLEALAEEVDRAHRLDRSLALVALDVDGLEAIAERLGRETADSVLDDVAGRLHESIGTGTVHRLGPDEFVLVLPSSTAHDAEALLGAVQGSLKPPTDVERVTLCAGITELADAESASAALDRAEHALRQAKQVGHGTVVVAVPGSSAQRPD
jgi:diguanylate cyclase (GGDEF)-like protein